MSEAPVLLLVFNRPAETLLIFNKMREIRPKKLFISADGPRSYKEDDLLKCQEVRSIVKNVDWDCEVEYLFSDSNLGCKNSISAGITWFFDHVEQGIILEDDCFPDNSFFTFCEELLEKYKDNEKIFSISGNNFVEAESMKCTESYFFSKYNHCWGWATWKRAWKLFDRNIRFWPEWGASTEWNTLLDVSKERIYWQKIFQRLYESRIDSWAYASTACMWYHHALSITPVVNLVSNIGFGNNATHTKQGQLGNLPVTNMQKIKHPQKIQTSKELDRILFEKVYYVSFVKKIIIVLRRTLKF